MTTPVPVVHRLLGVVVAALVGAGPVAAQDLRLAEAVRNQDIRAVRSLLKQKADVNARQADGETALHWAALRDDVDAARLLMAAGAQVDAANDYGVTPLFSAATNGSIAMVDALLKAGANAAATLPTGETVLMHAARSGRAEVVGALLARGADPNASERTRGQTALMWAIAETHHDVVRALVDRGADVRARSKSGFTPLLFAARTGDLALVRLLLDRGVDVNESADDGTTALLVAAVQGHVPLALHLLAQHANPNLDRAGYTALHWAAGTWESIVTHDYHVDAGEWSALAGVPTREGKFTLLKALLAYGADPNARVTKDPPRYGFTLFKRPIVIGATPFYLAALVADLDVMRLLLASGADPLIAAKDGTTPLMVAAGRARIDEESLVPETSHLDAAKLTLGLGADINATNDEGYSALHSAAYAGLDSVVQYLVDNGARLNDKSKKGQTPLSIAEGVEVDAQIITRPSTAALLQKLGGVK